MRRRVFMLTKTPFLPGFSTLLCGRAKRKDQDIVSAKFKEMTGSSLGELSQLFSAEIPASLLQSLSETKRDRLYSSYEIVSGVVGKGVAYIGRNYHARKVDFRRGRRIGKNQRLVTWKKPHWQPPGSCLSKKAMGRSTRRTGDTVDPHPRSGS